MRTKTLFSLLVLCGSTAAVAHMAPLQSDSPLQNNFANEGVEAPADPVDTTEPAPAPETAPAPAPEATPDEGTDPAPNATY